MKTIKIANYSIYTDGFYTADEMNFPKLYRGVRVNVDYNGSAQYMHFSIRTTKTRTCIFKTITEKMRALVFDDVSMSVTCDFENKPKNKFPHTLTFKEEVYQELKQLIPVFMKECGAQFERRDEDNKLTLVFGE